ncbi:unnamed protein product [Protopolystoma xenopodis]|uniref:ceramide glucosyltransferase n=1 Tax=Protopolystoma xenopodis TaxID=117903 RepID=A0A3S5A5E1_9PLAT|nr:unnamed protein product [Protopolystoma xenopodis]
MSHSGIKSTPGLHLLPSGYQGDESIEFPSEMSHNFGFVASTNSTSTTRHDQTLDLTVNFRESYPLINHSIYSSPEPVMYRKENCFVNQKGGDLNSAVNCTRTLIGPLGAIKLDSSNDLTGIGDHMDSLTQDNHSHDHQRYQGQHQRQYHIYTTQPSAQLLPVRFPPCEQVIQSELSIRPSFAWVLQLVYFGGWHAKIYMGAAMLGANCTTGMSCLMRREVLDRAGGLASFGQYLAEDYFISKAFYEEGWRVRIAHQPAWQNSPAPTVSQFHSRIFRWYQLRLAMLPQSAIAEPVTQCLTNGLICAFAWAHLCPGLVDPVVYLLVHLLIWFLLDYLMLSQMHPTYAHVSISKVS